MIYYAVLDTNVFVSAMLKGRYNQRIMDRTLDYYAENAEAFVESTRDANLCVTRDRFIEKLQPGTAILDLG